MRTSRTTCRPKMAPATMLGPLAVLTLTVMRFENPFDALVFDSTILHAALARDRRRVDVIDHGGLEHAR